MPVLGVVDRLLEDLRAAFPDVTGFSARNIWRMRAFYLAYSAASENLPQPVAQLASQDLPPAVAEIPWFHNIILIEKVKDSSERSWYAAKTLEHGWSRVVLTVQIESGLYQRQGKAITNFTATLPSPQSDLAQQTLKDPYTLQDKPAVPRMT